MKITQKISLDLASQGRQQVVPVKQEDAMTRELEIALLEEGREWLIPEEAVKLRICYAKADGTGGCYEKLPDDTPACSRTGNTVLARLHPQMFTCPGWVACELQLLTAACHQISTFNWYLKVEEGPMGQVKSEDYYNFSPLTQIGRLENLKTANRGNLVAAINEIYVKAARKINGMTPDSTGAVTLTGDDINVRIPGRQIQGTVAAVAEQLFSSLGTLSLLTTESRSSLVAAVNELAARSAVRKVNGAGPDAGGNVELTSDAIMMDNGEAGWGGYSLTEAADELYNTVFAFRALIPSEDTINGMIDAKLAALPLAEEVVFGG